MKAGTIWINYPAGLAIDGWIIPDRVVDGTTVDNWQYFARSKWVDSRCGRALRIWWPHVPPRRAESAVDYWCD